MLVARSEPSKKQVNRAGKLLRDLYIAMIGQQSFDFDRGQVNRAFEVVEWWRSRHAKPLARVNANLRHYVKKVGEDPRITQRLKRFSTIVQKLEREPTMALSMMEDIGGVRAILPDQETVFEVVGMLQKRWSIRRSRFYVEGGDPGPKPDGYRAVHLIVEKDGCFVELQLRTPRQDWWAQSVELDTRRLQADLKWGVGPAELLEYYVLVSEYIAMIEQDRQPSDEFMELLATSFRATRGYFPDPPRGTQ